MASEALKICGGISGVTEYPKTGYSTNIRLFWRYSKPTFQNWIHSTAIRIQPQYSTSVFDCICQILFHCKIVHFWGNFSWFSDKIIFFSIFPKKVLKVPSAMWNFFGNTIEIHFYLAFQKEINLELIFYKKSTF